jgi:hypothetical protein
MTTRRGANGKLPASDAICDACTKRPPLRAASSAQEIGVLGRVRELDRVRVDREARRGTADGRTGARRGRRRLVLPRRQTGQRRGVIPGPAAPALQEQRPGGALRIVDGMHLDADFGVVERRELRIENVPRNSDALAALVHGLRRRQLHRLRIARLHQPTRQTADEGDAGGAQRIALVQTPAPERKTIQDRGLAFAVAPDDEQRRALVGRHQHDADGFAATSAC